MPSVSGKVDPVVRRITVADIADAFARGLRDFQALPTYGLAFGALYAAGGITIVLCLTQLGMVYLAYPLAAGFALIGPFVAVGLYEVSCRREAGQTVSFGAIWSTVRSRGEIGWMAFVTLFFFVIWMYQVRLLIALLLGLNASFTSFKEFLTVVLTTNEGLLFLAIGNLDGAALVLDPLFADGGVIPAAAGPRGRFRHRDGDECARCRGEPAADDRLGRHHRGAPDRLSAALFSRVAGDRARAWPHHVASLSEDRRAGAVLVFACSVTLSHKGLTRREGISNERDGSGATHYGVLIPISRSAASMRCGGAILTTSG
jgi:hypothetical protein